MIRVLIAEDSSTARQLLVEILESDPELQVVGEASNGLEAIELAEQLEPDLIIMDVHMPQLDGLAATKEIMIRSPRPIVIVSSAANSEAVGLSLSATQAGALLALPKPEGPHSPNFECQRRELVGMAKAMAELRVVRHWGRRPVPAKPRPRLEARRHDTRIVALAASTGGPAALQRILIDLPREFPVPILVVQHIARGFVDGLVDWLGRGCALRVKKAEQNEPLLGRVVYLAPDGQHLGVIADARVRLAAEPPIRGFCPSATYLFESVANVYGPSATAVVLTGMGSDGVAGLARIRAAGGCILAQDAASSVVFGMAAEASRAGLVDELLPLGDIAPRLLELVATRAEP